MNTDQVNVRYMVEDVDSAIEFYTKHLGFTVLSNAAPAFADVTRGNLRLLLSGRKSSAGRAMPDGTLPGSWWMESHRNCRRKFVLGSCQIKSRGPGLSE